MTGLMMVCEAGHVGIARLLLGYGAPVEAVDGNGSSALLLAALEGQLEVSESRGWVCLYRLLIFLYT